MDTRDWRGWQLAGFLLLSITLNALGNGLTVCLNLGSALWTASSVNLSHATGMSLGNMMMLMGAAVIITNALIIGKLQWRRVVGNLVFMTPFSYLVQGATRLIQLTPVQSLPLWARVLLDFAGISLVGVAVSLYQRVNIMVHPNDDMMQIVRFKFFKGRAVLAQWGTYLIPLTLIALSAVFTHRVWAVNLGTAFALICQGSIVGWADLHIFPALKHRHIDGVIVNRQD
ncbi:YczE/YyaS/YitT family protein [Lacticaseibacillus parakribbianus]|uniref:YczE/YyaS/YitT family protein n=1 Tax=Lacticaseibacillus parakribbianus TaxID=2970927 RepID=UPI0021CB82E2|nr:hypothetical protein [Lacticaseibacillus parakribbianus]